MEAPRRGVDNEVSTSETGASFDEMEKETMKRHKMSRGGSRKHFSKHASYTHKKNMPSRLPMRGGIRL